ncbi:MAG: hypothetical protein WC455_18710 [Dehalococcoidia bacterium]
MSESRFQRFHTTRLPKRRRRIRVQGAHEDTGKWIKCWNCGFTINTDRLSATGRSGARHVVSTVPTAGIVGYGTNANTLTMDSPSDALVLMKETISGDAQPIVNTWIMDGPSGCPFCGCGNLP